MTIATPGPMRHEHEELHRELIAATRAGGRTAAAARRVAALLHPHFAKEDAIATPPLGMLRAIASGTAGPESVDVLELTDQLRAQLPAMLTEHHDIVRAARSLAAVARGERKFAAVRFAERLIEHAQMEEEVSYPAAMLVGDYLRAHAGDAGDIGPGAR